VQPCRLVAGGDQQHGGGVRANAVHGEQGGRVGRDEGEDQLIEAFDLGVEELAAAGQLADCHLGGVAADVAAAGPQRGQVGDQAGRGVPGEAGP
jgi:hypothetical protein